VEKEANDYLSALLKGKKPPAPERDWVKEEFRRKRLAHLANIRRRKQAAALIESMDVDVNKIIKAAIRGVAAMIDYANGGTASSILYRQKMECVGELLRTALKILKKE
jgi:hypothetical protein